MHSPPSPDSFRCLCVRGFFQHVNVFRLLQGKLNLTVSETENSLGGTRTVSLFYSVCPISSVLSWPLCSHCGEGL